MKEEIKLILKDTGKNRIKKNPMPTLFYKPTWSWDYDIEMELRKYCIGKTLNFPCGNSQLGDVRADIDKSVNPDIIADIMNPLKTFKKGEFDTVICDPPFPYYRKTGWVHEISKIARKRIIFCTPNLAIHLKSRVWKKEYMLAEKKAVYFFVKIFQIFTKKNRELK